MKRTEGGEPREQSKSCRPRRKNAKVERTF